MNCGHSRCAWVIFGGESGGDACFRPSCHFYFQVDTSGFHRFQILNPNLRIPSLANRKVKDQFCRPRGLLSENVRVGWCIWKSWCRKHDFSEKSLVLKTRFRTGFCTFYALFHPLNLVKGQQCWNKKVLSRRDESSDTQKLQFPVTHNREKGPQSWSLGWDSKISQFSDPLQKKSHNFGPGCPISTNRTFL